MKTIYLILSSLVLALVASCGGSEADTLQADMASTYSEFVDVLKGIDSPESAEAAAPKLKEVAGSLKALGERADALPDDVKAKLQDGSEGMNEEMKANMEAMMKEMTRLMQDPKTAAILGPIMEGMGK